MRLDRQTPPWPSAAAMLSESLPPSIALVIIRASHNAPGPCILAPSPSSFAAHIQFALSRTSFRCWIDAQQRLVNISQTHLLAIHEGDRALS